ncbi:MAG: hypothetical protein Q7U64_05715 [Desulfocapsaceae bacterium]|nr:hypothetical protein [Desulfocapsaceae bacterium]
MIQSIRLTLSLSAIIALSTFTLSSCVSSTGTSAIERTKKLGVSERPAPQPGEVNKTAIYVGYSNNFQSMKEALLQKKKDNIISYYEDEDKKLKDSGLSDVEIRDAIGLLEYLERGSIALTLGSTSNSLSYIEKAEEILEERGRESLSKEAVTKAGSFMIDMMGAGEAGRYFPNGFENVMALNVKAIDYLLEGDLRSYNVTRLANTWQDEEHEKFQAILDENEKKLAEDKKGDAGLDGEQTPIKTTPQKDKPSVSVKNNNRAPSLFESIDQEFSKYDAKALEVSSAYVNPFAHYLSGVIQEYKSYKDPSLKSNALISYKEALALNPKATIISNTIAQLSGSEVATKKISPSADQGTSKKNKKQKKAKKQESGATEGLLHVIAFDGFVPEKKVLAIVTKGHDSDLTVQIPVYDNVANPVASIKLSTKNGTALGELEVIADLESLCFRHQKDSLPLMYSGLIASGIRDVISQAFIGALVGKDGGKQLAKSVNNALTVDTRSWLSLPATIQASRIIPPKGLQEVVITTYDKVGKKLDSHTVSLNGTSNNFIFARTVNSTIYVTVGKPIPGLI